MWAVGRSQDNPHFLQNSSNTSKPSRYISHQGFSQEHLGFVGDNTVPLASYQMARSR